MNLLFYKYNVYMLLAHGQTYTCARHSTFLAFSLCKNSSGFITVAISNSMSDNSSLFTDNNRQQMTFSLSTDYWDKCKIIVSINSEYLCTWLRNQSICVYVLERAHNKFQALRWSNRKQFFFFWNSCMR